MRLFFVRFFSPSLGCFVRFFLSRFWAFCNKGSSKTRLKKIARKSPQLPKKVLTYVTFFLFFPRPPLVVAGFEFAPFWSVLLGSTGRAGLLPGPRNGDFPASADRALLPLCG
jgi:hypothetical protein